ncbi:MAG TPA: glutamine synthetase family protein [Candidatus Dormibacteraeota bacterium]|jgi:glutamine synthetase|nr:glutamine synthetase family protein [Candidatus Dormibacteraeota bacterium]
MATKRQPRATTARAATAAEILARAAKAMVAQVELQFADITGAVKSVWVPIGRLPQVLKTGEWFDGSAIEGVAREVESDMFLRPELSTFAITDPHADVVCARLLCDVVTPDGRPYPGDSRSTLGGILESARQAGLEYLVSPEVEFFLFPEGSDGLRQLADDPGSYFERSHGLARQAELEIVVALEAMGVRVESSHHEVASGQYELDLPMQPAMRAADALTTLKPAVKELARRRGLQASFMPKPLNGAAGSGMHTHQVLLRAGKRGAAANAFHDPGDAYGLSRIGRFFAAGQLEHAPGMCALVAPLVNSYKRLVPGYEAPVAGSWGRHNRSALIRVPMPSAIAGSDGLGTRLELRLPDPSCNPYLAFTAMLAAGLDGLNQELELGPPMEEVEHGYQDTSRVSAKALPTSLREALVALEEDDVLVDALGGEALELFKTAKELEWSQYNRVVTQWELETYLRSY